MKRKTQLSEYAKIRIVQKHNNVTRYNRRKLLVSNWVTKPHTADSQVLWETIYFLFI